MLTTANAKHLQLLVSVQAGNTLGSELDQLHRTTCLGQPAAGARANFARSVQRVGGRARVTPALAHNLCRMLLTPSNAISYRLPLNSRPTPLLDAPYPTHTRPGVLRTPGLEGRAMLDPYIAKSRARFVRRPYAPPSSHTAAAAKTAAAAAAAATAARPAPPQGVRRSRRGAGEEGEGGPGRLSQVAEDGEDDGPGEVRAQLCRACTCD